MTRTALNALLCIHELPCRPIRGRSIPMTGSVRLCQLLRWYLVRLNQLLRWYLVPLSSEFTLLAVRYEALVGSCHLAVSPRPAAPTDSCVNWACSYLGLLCWGYFGLVSALFNACWVQFFIGFFSNWRAAPSAAVRCLSEPWQRCGWNICASFYLLLWWMTNVRTFCGLDACTL